MSEFERLLERARGLLRLHAFDDAENLYARAAARWPSNVAAQFGLAKLRYMRGDPNFARDLAAAAARYRQDTHLQMQFADVLRMTGDLESSELLLRDLLARVEPTAEIHSALATVLHEAGRLPEALAAASTAVSQRPDDPYFAQILVTILLSLGCADEARPLIRAQRRHSPLDPVWIAHDATAARLTGDPEYERLFDYDRLVRVYDLQAPSNWQSMTDLNAALEHSLMARHRLARPPFDQSMRSGTQTLGDFLADPDPAIRATLDAFLDPIADYRARLGTRTDHPLSARNRGQALYAGCWSVLLKAQGFHVNHIHPAGWLSSAYYVSVPSEADDPETQSGWLKFGEPRMPVPGAGPAMTIQPRPGRLVLFPSYMWHGTTAIQGNAPRLSMAFDVVTGP